MRYIVAVSGGVDSVVLLDMLMNDLLPEVALRSGVSSRESWVTHRESQVAPRYRARGRKAAAGDRSQEIIVAHFEHGIRGEASKSDARFVAAICERYGLKFELGYGNLAKDTSEETARRKRYEFLKSIARKYDGRIVTAHHQDDLIETIAVNLTRGTGWRGLAVFGDASILRPLTSFRKADIYTYALKNDLEWVEDETNSSDAYLRNRLRRKLNIVKDNETRRRLMELYAAQSKLAMAVESEVEKVDHNCSRYFYIMAPESAAMELLRDVTGGQLTRPQMERALLAIKTFRPGAIYEAGAGISFSFTKRHFVVRNTSQMV